MLTALAEGPGSVSRTHMIVPVPGDSTPSSGLHEHCMHTKHINSDSHTYHNTIQ